MNGVGCNDRLSIFTVNELYEFYRHRKETLVLYMQSSMITTELNHILKIGSVKYTQYDLHLQELYLHYTQTFNLPVLYGLLALDHLFVLCLGLYAFNDCSI